MRSDSLHELSGCNAKAIGAWGMIFFAFAAVYPLLTQGMKIWQKRSGEAASVVWFNYFFFLCFVTVIYGWHISSIPLLTNGIVRTFAHIPIIWGLVRFKGFSKSERIFSVLLFVALVTMAVSSHKDLFYFIFCFGSFLSCLKQPYEIWKIRSVGVTRVELIIFYSVSNSFWIAYSFAIKNWALEISSVLSGAAFLIMIVVWFKYRYQKIQKAA